VKDDFLNIKAKVVQVDSEGTSKPQPQSLAHIFDPEDPSGTNVRVACLEGLWANMRKRKPFEVTVGWKPKLDPEKPHLVLISPTRITKKSSDKLVIWGAASAGGGEGLQWEATKHTVFTLLQDKGLLEAFTSHEVKEFRNFIKVQDESLTIYVTELRAFMTCNFDICNTVQAHGADPSKVTRSRLKWPFVKCPDVRHAIFNELFSVKG
jgi:hypothetical protein